MIVLNLIQNVALLVALAATFQVIGSRFEKDNVAYQVLSGLLFGGVGIIGMMTPINFATGIIFDGRSIILSVSGLFGGPLVAAIAASMCGIYRFWLGGVGAWVGVCVILESASLGVVFYFLWRSASRPMGALSLWGFGLLVHVIMLGLFLALPGGSGPQVLRQIGLPILILYPVATMLICRIFLDYERQLHDRKTLKEREQFLTAIVENIPDMIFVKDATDLRFVRFNRAGEDLLGYSREEMLGKNDYDFFPRDEADFFTTRDREILQTGTLIEIPEETVQTKHKGERILHTKKIPLYDEHGIAQYVLGISKDITDQKKAEDDLRKSEERYRRIVETANEGVWAIDGEFRTTFVNKRMADMLGYSIGEMQGRSVDSLIFDEDRPDHAKKMESRRQGENQTYERRFRRKDGGTLWTIVSATSLKDSRGDFAGSFAMLTDVTDRKQAEESLKQNMDELERINQSMVGRELRMIELKKEINELLKKAGEPEKYRIVE